MGPLAAGAGMLGAASKRTETLITRGDDPRLEGIALELETSPHRRIFDTGDKHCSRSSRTSC
jgi:hypothetical protein